MGKLSEAIEREEVIEAGKEGNRETRRKAAKAMGKKVVLTPEDEMILAQHKETSARKAFLEDYAEVARKHGLDFFPKLRITEDGIMPAVIVGPYNPPKK